ncbi:MAG TPA: GTPase HflX [Thermoanaerobaculia bacterium]|nr:GTPase HflX [Thermoanaerobaculia bacterium]
MPEPAVAVGLVLPDLPRTVAEEHMQELAELIDSAGGAVVAAVLAKRQRPDPATFIGSGKAEEIKRLAGERGATMIIFDDDLSPAQVRNLEKIVGVKVIDRSGLILDIFSSRARTREARTQVELARLEYLLPRLTRQWSHLSRQAGGAGGGAKRGVGETQLELDRRIVRTRISRLKEDLTRIEQNRETQRKARRAAFTVALVGYTNAGKSTLFNQLTAGGAEAMNKLFATLDSRSQKAAFAMPRETVVIDTVGFIRKLPHHLVASFRSTMEEAVAADVVLHLIDGSHPQWEDQRRIGQEVLADLGVGDDRVVEVFNKADRLDEHFSVPRRDKAAVVSALTGKGLEALQETIRRRQLAAGELMLVLLPHDDARLAARLHEVGEVYEQKTTDEGTLFRAWIPRDAVHLFEPFMSEPVLQTAKVS